MSTYRGVERDLKRYDPLLFLSWDHVQGRWCVMRRHRVWHAEEFSGIGRLKWYTEEPARILTLMGEMGEYRDPGEWVIGKLRQLDSQRFRRTKLNERRNVDLHAEIEGVEVQAKAKEESGFEDTMDQISKEIRPQAQGVAQVRIREKVA
mgnify:CR=1 FL=1